jgi:hypothetical protein
MSREERNSIPTLAQIEQRLEHYFEWYNNERRRSGQGMEGKTPMQVRRENEVEKREIPPAPPAGSHRYATHLPLLAASRAANGLCEQLRSVSDELMKGIRPLIKGIRRLIRGIRRLIRGISHLF